MDVAPVTYDPVFGPPPARIRCAVCGTPVTAGGMLERWFHLNDYGHVAGEGFGHEAVPGETR